MLLRFERNKTYTIVVMYSLYLYILGLSLRNTSKALDIFDDEKRSIYLMTRNEVILLYGTGFKALVKSTKEKEILHS